MAERTSPSARGRQRGKRKPVARQQDRTCRSRSPRANVIRNCKVAVRWTMPSSNPTTRKRKSPLQPTIPAAWQCMNADRKGDNNNIGQNSAMQMRLDVLTATHGLNSSCEDTSAYAQNGTSRERIHRVLSGAQQACSSTCKQGCIQKLKVSEVIKLCDLYWKLGQEERAYLVSCLKAEAEKCGQTTWALGNQVVCFDAWCATLGSTKRTILNMASGELDARRTGWVSNECLICKHFACPHVSWLFKLA